MRGQGGCWAQCPSVIGGWQCGTGADRAREPLLVSGHQFSRKMLWHRQICLGVQVHGDPSSAALCPLPLVPPPGLKLLKRLQPPVTSSSCYSPPHASPGDPATSPSKKPSLAPGDCDHPGAGGEGARPDHHWAARGDPLLLGFLPTSPNVIVAPRNNGSVCLSAAGGSVQLLGRLFLALSDQC